MILVDANVLVKLVHSGNPHQPPAFNAVTALYKSGEVLVACPQSLYEMYVVCSRPVTQKGLGLAPVDAAARLSTSRAQFPCQPDPPKLLDTWHGLVKQYNIAGKRAHDARLIAYMLEFRIQTLLTFNDGDFAQYTPITARNPFDVLHIPRV